MSKQSSILLIEYEVLRKQSSFLLIEYEFKLNITMPAAGIAITIGEN
ncbi:hypothetical protein LC607_07925 [Nostoc sp. CHAB 5824]|nr:hypothetical protein [Nostoc sp. CHAB 5824]